MMKKLRNWLIPMKRFKLSGLVLSVIGLLDNVTTLTAINNGAYELNPIVQPFLTSNELFALFTVVKCAIMYYVGSKLDLSKKLDLIIYVILVFFFVRAVILNILNSI
jgi:hypothetical protein